MKIDAIAKWRLRLAQPVTGLEIEDHYHDLINTADRMLHNRIIDDSEWRALVRTAGSLLIKDGQGNG